MFKKMLVLSSPALFLASACALAAGKTPSSYSNFTYPNSPSGLDEFNITLNVTRDPGYTANLYWSNQFGFDTGHEYGVIGMQSHDIEPNQRPFLFSIMNATAATPGSSISWCEKYTGSESGYACRFDALWEEGGSYKFQVKHVGDGWFSGTVMATQADGTVKEYNIGKIKTSASKIENYLSTRTDYLESSNDRATCLGQPLSWVTFSLPTGVAGGNSWTGKLDTSGVGADCKDFSTITALANGVSHINGVGNSTRGLLESQAVNGCLMAQTLTEGSELAMKACHLQGESGWVYSQKGSLEVRDNFCLTSSEADRGDVALRSCDHTSANFIWNISKGGQIKKDSSDMCLTDQGQGNKLELLKCTGAANQRWSVEQLGRSNSGCIISLDSGDEFCLFRGAEKVAQLPSWIYKKNVYVQADRGTAVILSDWDNLSYNRTATFTGTVVNEQLKNVKADNGEFIDFSQPASMRVVASETPLGCIVIVSTSKQFCLPAGGNAGMELPAWIKGKEVYVEADPGVSVSLSDWDNLSYGRVATFTHYVSNENLKNVKAENGEYLNFNKPFSMRVNAQ